MRARRSPPRSRWRALLCRVGLLAPVLLGPAIAAETGAAAKEETSERDELRQRLTEREDKLRPPQPWQIDIAGRPLSVSGEIGLDFERWSRAAAGGAAAERERSRKRELEAEAFYDVDESLAMFAQIRLVHERQTRANADRSSMRYAERGEMWLYGKSIAGSEFNLEFGRLKFEDDRRWWWDRELDAARLSYEGKRLEAALAFARELGRSRSDRAAVEPELERVGRWLAYATWDWAPRHALNLFALRHDDRSSGESSGQIVPVNRRDESDARLVWLGAGLSGEFMRSRRGVLSYHIDAASVRGQERLADFDPPASGLSRVGGVSRRDVRGWAVDTGLRWTASGVLAPRGFIAYAVGSGSGPAGADRAFRQTGLHANEAGFGGVKRFAHYGAAFDPELSNLRIATLGAGVSPSATSSLDVVAHRYRQVSPASSLRAARFATELNARDRDIGTGLDLVAAIELRARIEISAVASTFRSGVAFVSQAGRTHTFGALAIRIAY